LALAFILTIRDGHSKEFPGSPAKNHKKADKEQCLALAQDT